MKHTSKFDVIVVGGGHAGIEAAVMSSRLGAKTAIVTFDKRDIGTLSCNPAMGGLGKGHLIKEIDAMGGVIGKASDLSGIQFRVLNKTRGEAVQGPRAQIDREKYKENLKILLAKEEIKYLYDEVSDIILDESKNKKIIGLQLKSLGKVLCNSAIITTGTFLRGLIHQGCKSWSAGRIDCKPSTRIWRISLKNIILNFYDSKLAHPLGYLWNQLILQNVRRKKETPNLSPFLF